MLDRRGDAGSQCGSRSDANREAAREAIRRAGLRRRQPRRYETGAFEAAKGHGPRHASSRDEIRRHVGRRPRPHPQRGAEGASARSSAATTSPSIVSAMAGKTNELVGWVRETTVLYDAREYDAVVASGENVTAGLMALTLQEMGVPARAGRLADPCAPQLAGLAGAAAHHLGARRGADREHRHDAADREVRRGAARGDRGLPGR